MKKTSYLVMYENKYKEFETMLEALKLVSRQEYKNIKVKVYSCIYDDKDLCQTLVLMYYTGMEG